MNDLLIGMIASQLKIPATVLDQLKAARPSLVAADFSDRNDDSPIHGQLVTLSVQISEPERRFLVMITLPASQLQRIPAIYSRAVELYQDRRELDLVNDRTN